MNIRLHTMHTIHDSQTCFVLNISEGALYAWSKCLKHSIGYFILSDVCMLMCVVQDIVIVVNYFDVMLHSCHF